MMDETEKKVLARTKENLLRNLDAINGHVEQDGFPVEDHMVVDDIKDCVKSLRCIHEMTKASA